jgi:hypothetical protein
MHRGQSDADNNDDNWRLGAADGPALDRAGLWPRHVAIVEFHAGSEDLGAVGQFAGGYRRVADLARAALIPMLTE